MNYLYELNEQKKKEINEFIQDYNLIPLVNYNINFKNYIDKKIEKNREYNNKNKILKNVEKYLKSGSSGNVYKCKYKNLYYIIKNIKYAKKYGKNYDDIDRPENSELLMIKLLSYFIINNKNYNILLPITVIEQNDNLYILMEYINNGDLSDFIYKNNLNEYQLKNILFQVLYILYFIQDFFPNFKHNDMKTNNILIEKIYIKQKYIRYIIDDKIYYLKNIGYIIKLWDFDFSCIYGIIENKITTFNNIINYKKNRYYDICFFFNSLKKKINNKNILNFINNIMLDESNYHKGRLIKNKEHHIPLNILKNHEYFNDIKYKIIYNLDFLFSNKLFF